MQLKHLLVTVITLTSLSASAQINKGSIFLGGNVFFASQKSDGYDVNNPDHYRLTSFGISPSIGKAIRQNMVAGFDFTYYNSLTKANPVGKTTQQLIGGGVFIRKYAPLGKGFYLFGHARAGGSYNDIKHESGNGNDGKGYSITINAYPGISYEVTKKLHLEASLPGLFYLNYGSSKFTRPNGSQYSESGFSIGTSISNAAAISLGLRFLIAR